MILSRETKWDSHITITQQCNFDYYWILWNLEVVAIHVLLLSWISHLSVIVLKKNENQITSRTHVSMTLFIFTFFTFLFHVYNIFLEFVSFVSKIFLNSFPLFYSIFFLFSSFGLLNYFYNFVFVFFFSCRH